MPVQPFPPPWGQTQTPERAEPVAVAGSAGPRLAGGDATGDHRPRHQDRQRPEPTLHRRTGFRVIQSAATHRKASSQLSMVRGSCAP